MRASRPLRLGALLLLALGLGAGAGVPPARAVAQTAQGIAAVVNDNIVTTQMLADRMRLVRASTDLPSDPETDRRLTEQVLRGLIDEALQKQEARRLNIAVAPDELTGALRQIAQRNGLTIDQLEAYLAQRGSSIEALRAQIEAQILWLKVVSRRVNPKVQVTEEQVDLAMRAGSGPAISGSREVRLSEIVLPIYDPSQEPEVMSGARQLVAALRGGSQFESLARQVSAAATAETGGELGWVPLNALASEIRNAIAALKPGEVSDPIRGPAGVLIIKVNEVRDGDAGATTPAAAASGDRARVRQRLIDEQTQRLAARYLRDLRLGAFIDIRL